MAAIATAESFVEEAAAAPSRSSGLPVYYCYFVLAATGQALRRTDWTKTAFTLD